MKAGDVIVKRGENEQHVVLLDEDHYLAVKRDNPRFSVVVNPDDWSKVDEIDPTEFVRTWGMSKLTITMTTSRDLEFSSITMKDAETAVAEVVRANPLEEGERWESAIVLDEVTGKETQITLYDNGSVLCVEENSSKD